MKIRVSGRMTEEAGSSSSSGGGGGGLGRSWTRAEERLALRTRQNKRSRDVTDLRNKLKLSQGGPIIEECNFVKPEPRPVVEREQDPVVLERRTKQIDYGKNTLDYERYSTRIRREDRANNMPRTPNKHRKYSRRQWDGLVKSWKQSVHRIGQTLIKTEEPFEVGSWSEECDMEFPDLTGWDRRTRTESLTSSDQGLGTSCYSGLATPRSLSGCLSPLATTTSLSDCLSPVGSLPSDHS